MKTLRLTILAVALGIALHDSHAKGGGCCSGNSGTGHNGMPGVTSNGAMGFGATHAGPAPSPAPAPSPVPSAAPTASPSAAPTGKASASNGAGDSCQIVVVPWPGVPGLYHLACR